MATKTYVGNGTFGPIQVRHAPVGKSDDNVIPAGEHTIEAHADANGWQGATLKLQLVAAGGASSNASDLTENGDAVSFTDDFNRNIVLAAGFDLYVNITGGGSPTTSIDLTYSETPI